MLYFPTDGDFKSLCSSLYVTLKYIEKIINVLSKSKTRVVILQKQNLNFLEKVQYVTFFHFYLRGAA